jgi:hypothetical protein
MKKVVPCVFEKQILKTDHDNIYIKKENKSKMLNNEI